MCCPAGMPQLKSRGAQPGRGAAEAGVPSSAAHSAVMLSCPPGCGSSAEDNTKPWHVEPLCLTQHETSRGQLVNLLRVAGEPSVDMAVRQVASITFKQAAKRHWEPEQEGGVLQDTGSNAWDVQLSHVSKAPP